MNHVRMNKIPSADLHLAGDNHNSSAYDAAVVAFSLACLDIAVRVRYVELVFGAYICLKRYRIAISDALASVLLMQHPNHKSRSAPGSRPAIGSARCCSTCRALPYRRRRCSARILVARCCGLVSIWSEWTDLSVQISAMDNHPTSRRRSYGVDIARYEADGLKVDEDANLRWYTETMCASLPDLPAPSAPESNRSLDHLEWRSVPVFDVILYSCWVERLDGPQISLSFAARQALDN